MEAPGLAPLLPALSRSLLDQDLLLPSVEAHWLGDPDGLTQCRADPPAWRIRSAFLRGGAGPEGDALAEQSWRFAAQRKLPPSLVPCVGQGELLEPRGVTLRLFLLFDGTRWRALQGGVARVAAGASAALELRTSKDVWVLEEEGADILGPGNLSVAALPIRRTSGDMPSRVADNFYWFGRYLERLENAARVTRTLLARLSRAGIMPRDLPELQSLSASLVETGLISADIAVGAARAC